MRTTLVIVLLVVTPWMAACPAYAQPVRASATTVASRPYSYRSLHRESLSQSIAASYGVGLAFTAAAVGFAIELGVQPSAWIGPVFGGPSLLLALSTLGAAVGMDIAAGRWGSATSAGERDAQQALSGAITIAYVAALVAVASGGIVLGAGAANSIHRIGSPGGGGGETMMEASGVLMGVGWSLLWLAIGMDIGAGAWSGATRSSFAVSRDGAMLAVSGAF